MDFSAFFTPKEKISINFQSRYTDGLFPLDGTIRNCSHQEFHSARRSLVHNKNPGALIPTLPWRCHHDCTVQNSLPQAT